MRIAIAFVEFLHQLVIGWQFSGYVRYSQEAFPQYSFGEYFWLNYGAALGVVPVVLGTVLLALFRRSGRPVLARAMHASFMTGALLLVATLVIRSTHGWDVLVLPWWPLALIVLLYVTINV